LSAEAAHIVGISGSTIGAILVFVTTVFGAIGIALGFGWKLSLVGMSVMPPLIAAGFIRFWMMAQFNERTKQTTHAGSFVSQATASIRTVASLTMERVILQKYRDILVSEAMSRIGFIVKSSVAYAFSQSFLFFAVALGFWYGGKLVASGQYDILQFFVCFTETMFGAQAAGFILSFAPEVGSGRHAVENFKKIIETPGVDLKSGEKVADIQGTLEFRGVNFHYPERRAAVLQDFNLTARAGQFTAIVGQSGSGKSTALALIERFYEPTGGSILLDDQHVSKLSLGEYRQQLALVSQETTLYDDTIRENLLFDQEDIEDEAVEAACKSANIYDFIVSILLVFEK
jgi:ATP-binding cassette subfamily B (MDR/TAP) protein 1